MEATAKVPRPQYSEERKIYKKALSALRKKDLEAYNVLRKKLTKYPLYHYLKYERLIALDDLTEAEKYNFEQTNGSGVLARKLNRYWIELLGARQEWTPFLTLYDELEEPSDGIQCYYAQAIWTYGEEKEALRIAQEKWLVPYSQTHHCDPLFKAWMKKKGRPYHLAWQRYKKTIRARQYPFAEFLYKTYLGKKTRVYADLYREAFMDPSAIDSLGLDPKDGEHRRIFSLALHRLINADPKFVKYHVSDPTISEWLTPREVRSIKRRLAKTAVYQGVDGAFEEFKKYSANYSSHKLRDLELRYALRRHDWEQGIELIGKLSSRDKKTHQWRYWLARALEETNELEAADEIYLDLSRRRNYYGFLSADRLGEPYVVNMGGLWWP